MKPPSVLAILLLLTAPAFAQNQPSPSQMALQINAAVANMAMSIEALQTQLVAAQARVKVLEDKYEPKPSEAK